MAFMVVLSIGWKNYYTNIYIYIYTLKSKLRLNIYIELQSIFFGILNENNRKQKSLFKF